jgi:thioredoxin-related protein
MSRFAIVSRMLRLVSWLLALSLSLTSCAKLGMGNKVESPKLNSPFGETGIPPQLRSKGPDSGVPVVPGGNTGSPQSGPAFTPEEDIVFTNPDDPDASLPELSTVLTAEKRRGPWEESETIAKQRAAREGKPLLIWFTDSARSPMCKALSQELFSTPKFEQWASEKLIRLRIDANIQVDDPDLTLDEKGGRLAALKDYVARLKKQYKILGQPSLILLNSSGEVIGNYRGYTRGQADYYMGLFKQGEAVSTHHHKEWRAGLEKKGYREWRDRKDRKVFAKLTRYSGGTLTLIEPDGTRSRTREDKLSDTDQAWIDEQKKLRGLRQ